MANTIEIILKAIDKASDVIRGVEEKTTSSTATMSKAFEGVGTASDAVNKKLAEYGAAIDDVSRIQNQLKQAQFEAVEAANKLAQAQQNLAANTDPNKTEELNKALIDAQVQLDKAGQEVQSLNKDLEEGGKAAKGGAQGFESFAGKLVAIQAGIGIAKEAIAGLKEVWDFAKEGAENQRIAESFDRTAKSIGANADDIIKKLDAAAHGTVDDEELMQASTRALTLGVAKSGNDLVNVMKLARAAALQFGGDAGQAFETINQAIGNLAPRALKQFGIIVNLKEANEAYAKAIGLTADSLTEEQQRQALLNAVLEQGTKTFKDIGDSATTTGEKMKAVETRIANLVDIAKELAATGVGTALDITDAPKNAMEAFIGTARKMKEEVIAGRMSVKDYNDGLHGMASIISGVVAPAFTDALLKDNLLSDSFEASTKGAYGLGGALDESNRAARRSADEAENLSRQNEKLAQAQNMATAGAYGQSGALDESERAMRRNKEAAAALAESQQMVAQDMADLKTVMGGALKNEMTQYSKNQDDLQKKLADTAAEIKALESAQGGISKTTIKHEQSTAQLAQAQARLAATQARLAKETDPAKQRELAASIAVQQENINSANQSVVTYVDNSKKIADLKQVYDDTNKAIEENAAAHEEATKRIIYSYAEQQLAVGGFTSEEADALDALAVKLGLKSEIDVAALKKVRDAAKELGKSKDVEQFARTVTGAAIDVIHGTDRIKDSLIKVDYKVHETDIHATNLQTTLTNLVKNPYVIQIDYHEQQIPTLPGRTTPLPGGAQHGADFVVPPGFPNDTFPLRVSSGERVQVTPRGQAAGGVSMGDININIGGSNATPDQIKQAVYSGIVEVFNGAMQ